MNSPIKAEIKSFKFTSLMNDAKEIGLFKNTFVKGSLLIRPDKTNSDTILNFIKKYPSISYKTVRLNKKLVIEISEEGQFFDLLLALVETELSLLTGDINEVVYENTRTSILREFRRNVPFTSETYKNLENELTREKLNIDTSTDEFKESVKNIVADVKRKRAERDSSTERNGLLG